MPLPAILIGIGTVIASIWAGLSTIARTTFDIARIIFDYIWHFFLALYLNAPKLFKIIIFLFLLLFMANAIVGTILHFNFYCNSQNDLMRPKGFYDGIKLFFTTTFSDIENSTLTYDEYLANNTVVTRTYGKSEAENLVSVRCLNQVPRLTLFGVLDFLDYKMWILLLIIGGVVALMKEKEVF